MRGSEPARGLYLLVRVQQEAVPDGAQPLGGQHAAPLSAAGGARAAEARHHALHQDHRVVHSQEETVGEEAGQNLECDEQVFTRASHFLPHFIYLFLFFPFFIAR